MASPIKQILLHDSFRVGITLKGLDGVLEVIASAALYMLSRAKMTELVRGLVEHMVARMPNGYLAAHLIAASQKLNNDSREFAVFYLLTHGLVMYDALYAWCRSLQSETRSWPPAMPASAGAA